MYNSLLRDVLEMYQYKSTTFLDSYMNNTTGNDEYTVNFPSRPFLVFCSVSLPFSPDKRPENSLMKESWFGRPKSDFMSQFT